MTILQLPLLMMFFAGGVNRSQQEISTLVTPDTLLRWYRRLIASKYDGSETRRPRRPRTAAETGKLILRMAQENPGWGYTRIRCALRNVGHEIECLAQIIPLGVSATFGRP